MSLSSYSPELIEAMKAYAACLGPTPQPQYQVVHDWHPRIHIPAGHLPVEVAQFSPGNRSDGRNRHYQWAIFIPTWGSGLGNYYQIGGSQETGYFTQHLVNKSHPKCGDAKGTHLVGWVHPDYLGFLERHFSSVPLQNGQTWVVEGLKGLNERHIYAVHMNYDQLSRQMKIVEMAWEDMLRNPGTRLMRR